jgi:hypothetical protein
MHPPREFQHTIEAGDIRNTKPIRHDLHKNFVNVTAHQVNVSHTSPQPYSRKYGEESADVLSTQWLARFTMGSSNISGTLSPSLSTFLSPEPGTRARDKHHTSV